MQKALSLVVGPGSDDTGAAERSGPPVWLLRVLGKQQNPVSDLETVARCDALRPVRVGGRLGGIRPGTGVVGHPTSLTQVPVEVVTANGLTAKRALLTFVLQEQNGTMDECTHLDHCWKEPGRA